MRRDLSVWLANCNGGCDPPYTCCQLPKVNDVNEDDQPMITVVPKIDCIMLGGVDCGGEPEYFIEDEISHLRLDETVFRSREEAQAYLDAHREEILRQGLPVLDADWTELYGKVIERTAHKLENGAIEAEEARKLADTLAKIEDRCPDETFRQRLASVLARLRTF